jgi:uncharacterized protein (TIGR04255 family)
MATSRHLGSNAPITEALIDIFAALPSGASLDRLRALHECFKDTYPEIQARRRYQGLIQFSAGSVQSQTQSLAEDGFFFKSPDKRDVVQFRMDGFTVNRLAPYRGFEEMHQRAAKYWRLYCDAIAPESVLAVGVRYINRIAIPVGVDVSRYFSVAPQLPDGFVHMENFSSSTTFVDPSSGAMAEVALARDPTAGPTATGVGCLLEIAAQQQLGRLVGQDEVDAILASLRALKNKVFFGCITDECVRALTGEA